MKNLSLIALLFLVVFSACKKDEPIIDNPTSVIKSPIDDWQPVVENINGSLVGQVNNESGSPIINATVTLNNETTTTNQYGFFFFDDTTMNSKGSYVKVEKNGYFLGSRRFFPQADVRSNVKITLLRKDFSQSFLSTNESLMEFEGASVKFSANSIAKENGEAYTGNVNFSAKWLDPSSPEVFLEMPGNLQGVNSGSEEVVLKTLGMIAVELEDDEGNELNILSGNTAIISVPVPQELRANAPAEIPLWSFDEEYGMWVEEGIASLENGVYVGEVAHFSFWNCDIPTDYTNISLTVLFDNGEPFIEGRVALYSEDFGSGVGFPDNDGNVSGIIPANQTLQLKMFSNQCSEPIYEQSVGPFSEDTDLGVITIDNQINFFTTITGTLTDCADNIITNGFFKINTSNGISYHSFNSDSPEFVYTNISCDNLLSMSIVGIDLENGTEGMPVDIIIGDENNIGNLSACGGENNADFISLNIEGVTKNYFVTDVIQIENDSTIFISSSEEAYILFRFAGLTSGSYSLSGNTYLINDDSNNWYYNNYYASDIEGLSEFEVVEEANGKFFGTISGNIIIENGESVSVEGEFRITPPE